ncbi:MAG: hypothetical protein NZ572_07660 [Thermoflexus sp.]|nr:hypothetical protein [Thermoflexus sp.]
MVSIIVVRWHYIAVPTRRLALSKLHGLRERWKQEMEDPFLQSAEEQALGERIEELLNKAEAALSPSVWERLLWPRGAELKAWRLIHEAESLIALGMNPVLARERLKQLQGTSSSNLGEQATASSDLGEQATASSNLTQQTTARNTPRLSRKPSEIQAQLYWFLRKRYDEVDTSFAVLSTAHAKTSWLIYVGISLGGALLVFGQAVGLPSEFRGWMLFGAIGAFLSRCLRMLRAPRVPTDYGFFWIQLFIAPVFGALAGPASILLLDLVVRSLSMEALQTLQIGEASSSILLALSLLAGLSERWLDRLKDQAEGVLNKIEKKDSKEESPETKTSDHDKEETKQNQQEEQKQRDHEQEQKSGDLPLIRGR